jgi:NADH-quinone oxidoreductase subunit K
MLFDSEVLMATGTVLLFIGVASISLSRNLIKTVMSFQILLFGANLALFASGIDSVTRLMSDTFVLISLVVGAAVESVGLAIVVMVYRKYGTLDPAKIRKLRN